MALYERPLQQIKTVSSATTRRRVKATKLGDIRAQHRFAWATFARGLIGSMSRIREALIDAMRRGLVPEPPLKAGKTIEDAAPSETTVARWIRMPPEQITIEGLRRHRGGGRPRENWHPAVRIEFEHQVSTGRYHTVAAMQSHLKNWARKEGMSDRLPTYGQLRHHMGDIPLVRYVAARHGKRAAIADAVVHGAVPADFAHQVSVLDELEFPVWGKAYSWKAKQVVGAKMTVCLVIDSASGVVVSYYMGNPLARDVLRGMDRWDILATFTSALFPELAPPACRAYSGWIPSVLRYDRATVHAETASRLATLEKHLAVEIPDLPGLAPWARGLVEITVKTIKAACRDVRGHEDFYTVAEYARADALTPREAAARPSERLPEKVPILIENLHTIEELSAILDGIVRTFNEELVHDVWKMTRAARYTLTLQADKLRSGRDAVSILEPHRIKVSKKGIVVNRIAFEAQTDAVQFDMGSYVSLRLDPALRGVFAADTEGALHFMRPARDAASTKNPADVAHAINSLVSEHDKRSRAAKYLALQREVGPENAEIAIAIADEELDALKTIELFHSLPAMTDHPGQAQRKPTRAAKRAMTEARAENDKEKENERKRRAAAGPGGGRRTDATPQRQPARPAAHQQNDPKITSIEQARTIRGDSPGTAGAKPRRGIVGRFGG